MIKVCDAIMGSGKTSAAINYMNSHPTKKFIYITPYLEEAERIRNSCPSLEFEAPDDKLSKFGYHKLAHTMELINNGKNIVSTHNLFLRYSSELIDTINRYGYILIVDEAVDMLRQSKITKSDITHLEKSGWIATDGNPRNNYDTFEIDAPPDYIDGVYNEIISLSKGNRLVCVSGRREWRGYYWLFSKDIFLAFKDVIILTYLFEAQTMKYYFDIFGIKYTNIWVSKRNGQFWFSDIKGYIPDYVRELSDKIHIFENKKINSVSDNKCALSASWFKRNDENTMRYKNQLKMNVDNFLITITETNL